MNLADNRRPIEISGRVWGAQLPPPGVADGGTFQILLPDSGKIIAAPFHEKWRWEILPALQANDVRHITVKGIAEYSPEGEPLRIAEVESVGWYWARNPLLKA